MFVLTSLLPVFVALTPFALIVGIVFLINRRIAKKVAIVFGIGFCIMVLIALVTLLTGGRDHASPTEQSTVEVAAKRNFRDNFVRVETPANAVLPANVKFKYVVVLQNYETQYNVDSFISDACDKLQNKGTNIEVQPLQKQPSQPTLIDRSCNAL